MAAEIIMELKRMITNLAYKLESRQSIEYVARELDMVSGILSEVSMMFEDPQIDHAMECLSSASNLVDNMVHQQQVLDEEKSFGVEPTLVYGETGRPKIDIPLSQLEFLIDCNFKQKDIAELFGISVRTLRTRLSEYGIQYNKKFSTISDEELDVKTEQILINHPDVGYRSVRAHLLADGENLQEIRVRESVRRLDLEGCILRRLTVLKPNRRKYNVKAPNSLWHIDGYHKLISWRMVIHGGIDGFSRLPVYLTVSDNNRSETVVRSFIEAVQEYGIPDRVRSDKGGENVGVAKFMVEQKGEGRGSHITGRSVHNQRIERFWRDLWTGCIGLFYNLFCSMENQGILLSTDELHLYALHYVFLPRIQNHLDFFRNAFMRRPLRTAQFQSPIQMWTYGQMMNPSESLTHENIQDFGVTREGLWTGNEPDCVEIHQNSCIIPDDVKEELRNHVDPLQASDSHGIDLFCETVNFVTSKIDISDQ